MTPSHSTVTFQLTVAGLATAGILSILTGIYPGAVLLAVAVVVGVVQRSKLAKSTRVPDTKRRRRLMVTALVLAAFCVSGSVGMILELQGDESWNGGKLVIYNLFFFATAFSALGYLIAGLRTPRHLGSRPSLPV